MKNLIVTAALLGSLCMSMPACAVETNATEVAADASTFAKSVFDMSTNYPGIYAKPGETTSFGLDFINTNEESLDASLQIDEIPDNWEGFFKGKSGEISKVHVASSDEASKDLATFSLTIPEDAKEGVYEVRLLAKADDGTTDDVTLEVNVSEQENGASTFTSQYPEQQAASGTKFSFDTSLANNKGTDQSYSLTAKVPEGWQVTFTPSGETASVASVNLDAGANKSIAVAITPPETLMEGEYIIPISAISSAETVTTELKITITGKYAVSLSTPSGALSFDAYANNAKDVTLSVTNTGNVDLENLNLTSAAPADWDVSFDESSIALLEAGATKELTAHVTPAADSITGDYVTEITVKNDAVSSAAQFRVSVKTRTTWGFAALGIIVVLVVILGVVFKKYGRR